ncbi:hypothetical protein FHT76_006626 [Rhizobium sp. BK176]|nr:hypothetical protein [Rhizobium sp. BK181]MBB3543009.1 hypothetical protein [Rhizobium sp. BK399]MCS3743109.1 hypothetical protein [Rhizobium sp. BK661]MCS4094917.1 hypothetical protein [Rhizobium sp. BK176]
MLVANYNGVTMSRVSNLRRARDPDGGHNGAFALAAGGLAAEPAQLSGGQR